MKPDKPKTAIALTYDPDSGGAPRVSAKGQDAVAEEILALARANGVHLHEDKQLAAALAQIPLGDDVPQALYVAVAEVLAFAYYLSGREPEGYRS